MVRHARAAFQGRGIGGERKVREQDPRDPAPFLDARCHARVPAVRQASADRSIGQPARISRGNSAQDQTGNDRNGGGS